MRLKDKNIIPWILAILVTTLVFLILPLVHASIQSLPTSKINQEMQLTQTVTNSTYCNISKITYPNNSILNLNKVMTKLNNDYNYSYTPNTLGEYSYITCCNPDSIETCVGITFIVTNTGYETTLPKSIIMLIGLAIMFLIGTLLFFFGFYSNNLTIKIFVIGLSILILAFSVGYGLNITNNSIGEFTYLTSQFSSLYILLTVLLSVGGMGLIVFLIYFILKLWSKQRGFED